MVRERTLIYIVIFPPNFELIDPSELHKKNVIFFGVYKFFVVFAISQRKMSDKNSNFLKKMLLHDVGDHLFTASFFIL